jgi:hypothetical protein
LHIHYHGEQVVFVIDGMDAIEACYFFAGVTGHDPDRYSLRELWTMSNGYSSQRRIEMLQFSSVVFGTEHLDLERFIRYGIVGESGKGGPVQVSPGVQERIEAEIEKIRAQSTSVPFKVSH